MISKLYPRMYFMLATWLNYIHECILCFDSPSISKILFTLLGPTHLELVSDTQMEEISSLKSSTKKSKEIRSSTSTQADLTSPKDVKLDRLIVK